MTNLDYEPGPPKRTWQEWATLVFFCAFAGCILLITYWFMKSVRQAWRTGIKPIEIVTGVFAVPLLVLMFYQTTRAIVDLITHRGPLSKRWWWHRPRWPKLPR